MSTHNTCSITTRLEREDDDVSWVSVSPTGSKRASPTEFLQPEGQTNDVLQSVTDPCQSWKGESYVARHDFRLNTEVLSSWIGDRIKIGQVFATAKLRLLVKCTSRTVPTVTVDVLPRDSLSSRVLTVRASLLIPTRCSRHKWLVHYTDSVLRLTCSINREREGAAIKTVTAEEKIAASPNAPLTDHVTSLTMEVINHDQVLYEEVDHFVLHLQAYLVVHGFRSDASASDYMMVDLEDPESTEIVKAEESTMVCFTPTMPKEMN